MEPRSGCRQGQVLLNQMNLVVALQKDDSSIWRPRIKSSFGGAVLMWRSRMPAAPRLRP